MVIGAPDPEEGHLPFPKAQSRIHLKLRIPTGNEKLLRGPMDAKIISNNAVGFLARKMADTEGQRNRHTQGTGDPDTR